MTNPLEQPHNRPRLVAVVGGRRRPMPAAASSTNAARRRSAPATAVSRAAREANRLDRARSGSRQHRSGGAPRRAAVG